LILGRAFQLVNERLGRRALVWATLLAAAGLALCFVPLFDVLGYDYAFALGLLTAFAAVDIGHGAVAAARLAGRPLSLLQALLYAEAAALAALLLPLAFALLNALRVRNCDMGVGLAFYLLLPVGTAVYAAAGGALCGWWLRGRRGRVAAYLLPVVSIVWTLLRLYYDPPVFAYDPFGGYFPGPIYDEAMRPPPVLVRFRLVNLVWIAAAVLVTASATAWRDGRALVQAAGGRRRPRGAFLLLVVASLACGSTGLALYARRASLGFHVDRQHLVTVLRRASHAPNVVVHSDPTADGTDADRQLLLRDLAFRYQQLARTLGAEPSGPVSVYLFPSAEAKKALVGAGATLYAKPWTREIFLQAERFPSRRLRHELAHVFAGAFGDRVFGISLRWRLPVPRLASGLVEGIAEAADYSDPDGRTTVHQEARAMIAAGLAPPLASVIGAGFSTVSGPRAYTLAGSFTHHLLATHGPDRLRQLYRSGGDFAASYGRGLAELERDWRSFLERQPLDDRERARARERFRRPAIFGKVCARELAARVAQARDRLYTVPEEAVALFRSVCEDDPGEPSYRLDLAEAHFTAGGFDQALAELGAVERDPGITEPLRARAANIAANVHYHRGDFAQATEAAQRALTLASEDGEQRTAMARLRALRDDESRRSLGRVLFGDSPTRGVDAGLLMYLVSRFADRFPEEALGPYLLGRQLAGRDPALALPALEAACPLAGGAPRPQPLPPLFAAECHRLTGEAAFRAGDLARSRLALTRLQQDATTEADRLRAGDFLERLDWERQRQPASPAPP
jgi:tetratricopeptide (TPR) repeat protein